MFFQTTYGIVYNLGVAEGFQVYSAFDTIYITSLDSKYLFETFNVKNDGGFCYLDKRKAVAITDDILLYTKTVCDLIINFLCRHIQEESLIIKTKDIIEYLECEIYK